MYPENRIYKRAYSNYGVTEGVEVNNNQKVIRGLSVMILRIWQEWRADTRHYQPAKRDYERYMSTVSRGEALLDPQLEDYDKAVEAVADCKEYLRLVVLYRVRAGKNRVF